MSLQFIGLSYCVVFTNSNFPTDPKLFREKNFRASMGKLGNIMKWN